MKPENPKIPSGDDGPGKPQSKKIPRWAIILLVCPPVFGGIIIYLHMFPQDGMNQLHHYPLSALIVATFGNPLSFILKPVYQQIIDGFNFRGKTF